MEGKVKGRDHGESELWWRRLKEGRTAGEWRKGIGKREGMGEGRSEASRGKKRWNGEEEV